MKKQDAELYKIFIKLYVSVFCRTILDAVITLGHCIWLHIAVVGFTKN